jgi:hypothetical protein
MEFTHMTKDVALQSFFEGFEIPAYPSSSVPEDVVFPWLTYDPVFSDFGNEPVSVSVNLWYRTESEKIPNEKAFEIEKAIGEGGKTILCDEGIIWIKKGSPFCQNLRDETDSIIKRRYIQLVAEFLTI